MGRGSMTTKTDIPRRVYAVTFMGQDFSTMGALRDADTGETVWQPDIDYETIVFALCEAHARSEGWTVVPDRICREP